MTARTAARLNTEAWVYPERGRALDKWSRVLREDRTVAVDAGDVAMKRFLGACYKGYVGRIVNPDMWTAIRMQHHHQPIWRVAIMAHCRWRGRRFHAHSPRDRPRPRETESEVSERLSGSQEFHSATWVVDVGVVIVSEATTLVIRSAKASGAPQNFCVPR